MKTRLFSTIVVAGSAIGGTVATTTTVTASVSAVTLLPACGDVAPYPDPRRLDLRQQPDMFILGFFPNDGDVDPDMTNQVHDFGLVFPGDLASRKDL